MSKAYLQPALLNRDAYIRPMSPMPIMPTDTLSIFKGDAMMVRLMRGRRARSSGRNYRSHAKISRCHAIPGLAHDVPPRFRVCIRKSVLRNCDLTTFIPLRQLQIAHDIMPPKKKVERPAQENISLGPQVREGQIPKTYPSSRASTAHNALPTIPIHRSMLTTNRRAGFRHCKNLRVLQRHLRPCYRSFVSAKISQLENRV